MSVPRGTPDPIALALAAAIREIAARQASELVRRRAKMAVIQGGRGGRAA